MTTPTFYTHLTQLWEDGSVMASKSVRFRAEGEWIVNVDGWDILTPHTGRSGGMELRRTPGGPPLYTCHPQRTHNLTAGDTLSYLAGQLKFGLDGGSMAAVFSRQEVEVHDMEEFIKQHPHASIREAWDAAFAAGFQTAHILLTGDPQ